MCEINGINTAEKIRQGKTYLGIEFGSTRIKAVLTDDSFAPIASGSHEWENKFENGYWTYSREEIINGLQNCYASLANDVREKYGVEIQTVGAMGISGMMHGYMPFDRNGNLLCPFRTWRNTTTSASAEKLTALFGFNIPQRWSIAHLYQAILNGEEHIYSISYITTLAVYIHYLLSGRLEAGIGEASGIFPISNGDYDKQMLEKFNSLISDKKLPFTAENVLPKVRLAGERGAVLTEKGALLLDPTGNLQAGIPMCPPEGDAGTGMTATNSVKPATGNISAGTSIFSMLVLEKPLKGVYPQIDIVTTPDGAPTAMVHCNNCCGELDGWVKIFGEFAKLLGVEADRSELYRLLYKNSLNGREDCGGITAYNFISSETVVDVEKGKPMYFRNADGEFTLANLFRSEIYSSMSALKAGMDLLFEKEGARAEMFSAHGGLFKVEGVAQQYLADALKTPVSVMKTAGEGGAWGMALLSAFSVCKNGRSLSEFLEGEVFAKMEKTIAKPDKKGAEGFDRYMTGYKSGLNAERAFV